MTLNSFLEVKQERTQLNGQVISLPDRRKLGYHVVGQGKPVVYFHGTASSRLEILLLRELASTAGLQIIGIDRPGYGLSSFNPLKNLQNFSLDVNSLTDHLGIKRFGVLGWSGGGVFALAYVALNSERVTKAVIAGTPALPFDVSTAHNIPFARFIMTIPFLGVFAMKRMSSQVLRANGDVTAFLRSRQGKQMLYTCSKSDLKFFSDPEWMKLMYQAMAEAFRQSNGVKAVLAEHQAFMKPWTFSFSKIPAGKIVVWHGSDDKTCRVANGYLIAKSVVGSQLKVFEGAGHCVMFDNFEKLVQVLGS
jgi:pimeloyl-ACP methyl ester carboxylesterase